MHFEKNGKGVFFGGSALDDSGSRRGEMRGSGGAGGGVQGEESRAVLAQILIFLRD